MFKKSLIFLFVLNFGLSCLLFGGQNTQKISVDIELPNSFVIEGPDPDFILSSFDIKPGKINEIVNENTGFIITVDNNSTKKIIAALDNEMPNGTELYVYFSPPTDAKTMGFQKLTTTNIDILRDLTKKSNIYTPAKIIYHLYFGREALNHESFSREIIYTLIEQ